MAIDRRHFLKTASTGIGLSLVASSPIAGAPPEPRSEPLRRRPGQAPDVVVVGAGNFGMWTALNLVRLGATVTVVDPYGAGNSRQTSGGETRGVRTSYGDRPHGPLWTRWANEAIRRWIAWDEEAKDLLLPRLFFQTGDLIMREAMEPYLEDTMATWDDQGIAYETFGPDEIRHRWPWIRTEGITVALYEPQAGVVRARRAIESVSKRFRWEGGEITIGRASPGGRSAGRLTDVALEGGDSLSAATFVFAVGPWFPGLFPEILGKRIRIPLGHVFYYAVPDSRYMHPNMPSYGVPGCTGWPALGVDHRGFRVRTGGRPPGDLDTSDRWIPEEFHEAPHRVVERYFPELVGQPISETRACHYEGSVTRNFIIDRHPEWENVWLAGGGSAESFKQGPVLGEYIAKRVLGIEDDPELAAEFRIPEEEFEDEEAEGRGSGESGPEIF